MTAILADHLPACLVEDGSPPGVEPFMRRFLAIFDEVAASVDDRVGAIEHLADPSVAPVPMVQWMAGWLGVDVIDTDMADLQQRDLVARTGRLLGWRGTGECLRAVLELATGQKVEVSDTGGVEVVRNGPGPTLPTTSPSPAPKHVVVKVAAGGALTDEQLLGLLRSELPADVTFELNVDARLVRTTAPSP